MSTAKAVSRLSDRVLLSTIRTLCQKETEASVELLLHLIELEKRGLFLKQGYSSLFDYCVSGLRYSEPAASRRVSSARACAKFPGLIALLLKRELSLTTLSMVSTVLTQENYSAVIGKIRGKSRREVELFLAELKPEFEKRERIRAISVAPAPKCGVVQQAAPLEALSLGNAAGGGISCSIPGTSTVISLAAADEMEATEPSAVQKFEFRFSVSKEVKEKFEEVSRLLSGKYGKGLKIEQVFEEALEMFLEHKSPARREQRREKRNGKRTASAQAVSSAANSAEKDKASVPRPPDRSRHIPNALRDQVWLRDGGRCAFVGIDGKRCASKYDLELHHKNPFAKEGAHSSVNLSLRCRAHNIYHARQDFGLQHMLQFSRRSIVISPPAGSAKK